PASSGVAAAQPATSSPSVVTSAAFTLVLPTSTPSARSGNVATSSVWHVEPTTGSGPGDRAERRRLTRGAAPIGGNRRRYSTGRLGGIVADASRTCVRTQVSVSRNPDGAMGEIGWRETDNS